MAGRGHSACCQDRWEDWFAQNLPCICSIVMSIDTLLRSPAPVVHRWETRVSVVPFIGQTDHGIRVDITDYAQPKLDLKSVDICCPYCESGFSIVMGEKVSAHFRHRSVCTNPIAQEYFSGETQEHRRAKALVKELFVRELRAYTTASPELEVYVEEAGRIADLLVEYPFGYMQAIEVQLSRVTEENIRKRTEAYISHGIDVLWLLGPKCRDITICDYLTRRLGCFYHIDVGDRYIDIRPKTLIRRGGGNATSLQLGEHIWKHMLILIFARYLQVYRVGFSPDFRQAMSGTLKVEKFFGGQMNSLQKRGAVVGREVKTAGYRYSPKLWRLNDLQAVGLWIKERRVTPMKPGALGSIRRRARHTSSIPCD